MNHGDVRARFHGHLEGELSLVERGAVDAHLAGCAACAEELRALRETVSQVRGLPDPEVPRGFAEAVMARVEAGDGRPQGLWAAFRGLATPRAAAPLAAGAVALCAVAWWAGAPGGPGRDAASPLARAGVESLQPPSAVGRALSAPDARGRLAFFGPSATGVLPDDASDPLDGQLDRGLERLLENPDSFLERVEDGAEGERLLGRLAGRAARRGNAVAAASRLLASEHPRAEELAIRFLHASLVESLERRAGRAEAESAIR